MCSWWELSYKPEARLKGLSGFKVIAICYILEYKQGLPWSGCSCGSNDKSFGVCSVHVAFEYAFYISILVLPLRFLLVSWGCWWRTEGRGFSNLAINDTLAESCIRIGGLGMDVYYNLSWSLPSIEPHGVSMAWEVMEMGRGQTLYSTKMIECNHARLFSFLEYVLRAW